MPCRDYYDDHPQQYFKDVTEPALKKQISFAESALCAALDTIDKMLIKQGSGDFGYRDAIDAMDLKEAGITEKDLRAWRKNHKELDKKHREEEKRKLKASALAKLTPEEIAALGVK
jgi:hypothetical protein